MVVLSVQPFRVTPAELPHIAAGTACPTTSISKDKNNSYSCISSLQKPYLQVLRVFKQTAIFVKIAKHPGLERKLVGLSYSMTLILHQMPSFCRRLLPEDKIIIQNKQRWYSMLHTITRCQAFTCVPASKYQS